MKKFLILSLLTFIFISCEEDKSTDVPETSKEYINWFNTMYKSISDDYNALVANRDAKKDSVVAISREMAEEKIADFTNTQWKEYAIKQDNNGFYVIMETKYTYSPYELKKEGLDLPDGILTIQELVDALC